jgi:diaminopimelate epimerase
VNPAPRTIPFVKVSAYGNDFLLIDASLAPEDIHGFTRRICDRHNGVGADGIEWIRPHFTANAEIRLINADGSDAEISGNGTRCVAAYLCAQQGKDRISILTGAGTKSLTLMSRKDSEYEFEADMGEPVVDPEFAVKISGGEIRGLGVSMGNPHFVTFVGEFPADWQSRSMEIQRSVAQFPQGVNVVWVRLGSRHEVQARFFERGAGETRSSGTGSCSAAMAAMVTGRADSPVKVHGPGGPQNVRKEGNRLFLRGSARIICRGEFFVS